MTYYAQIVFLKAWFYENPVLCTHKGIVMVISGA